MRPWAPTVFGFIAGLAACGESRPFGGDAGGTDASMTGDARTCASNADCNDNTPCTTDRCLVGGVCENAADNTMCTAPMACVSGRGCVAPGARPCTSPADCDDRVACTRDTCLVEGVCRNQPDDAMCPAGQVCNAASGCGASMHCTSAADCDDHVACTEDTCGVDGQCVHVPQNMRCMTGQSCNATMGCVVTRACESNAQCDDMVYCDGVETCSTELACVAGTPVNCDDMDPCTHDACDEAMRACTHTREPSCTGMMPHSGIYPITPRAMYQCMDSVFSMVVVSFDLMQLNIVATAGGLTVSGMGIPTMTGPAPTATGMFTVRGTRAGDCNENYELSGTFSSATMFSATFRVSFAGSTCALTDCTMQTFMFSGTATM